LTQAAYRFIDLRRDKVHRNMMLRSNVIASIRRRMIDAGFTEFQTPILTADSPEGARAFLVPEATVAQRIVRAKRTLAAAKVPFEVPAGDEIAERLASVLEVVYIVFNEGYAATAGDDWVRPGLCEDALRLGRILAELMPNEPEVHGLVALMEIQASRLRARVGPSGEPVLLLDQDRGRWDQLLIRRGLAALKRAESLAEARGPYTVPGPPFIAMATPSASAGAS